MNIAQAIKEKSGDIEIHGWVHRERGNKNLRFIVLRDTDNIIQCVVKQDAVDDASWQAAVDAKVEAAVRVRGSLHADERAPTGVELQVKEFELIGSSNEFPITKDQSPEHLANFRHLWLRSRKMNAMLKVRAAVFRAFREYFDQNGFYEFHSPIFQSTQAEGGSELFAVKYFEDELYLSQTWQLYAEAGIFSCEKLYTIAPTFRAENSKTSRHLTEFWMGEAELAWADFDEVISHAEGVITHIAKVVLADCDDALAVLGRNTEDIAATAQGNFPRMTYTEVLALLKEKNNMDVPWGKDLRTKEEDELSKHFDRPVIVTHYPKKVKAFYMKEDADNPDVVLGLDFIAPLGYGEIVGGSQREEDIDKLITQLKAEGEDPADYEYYLDIRKYGSVQHGGFGVGMERVISWMCGFDTIKDAIAFPRTPLRYKP